MEVRLHAKAKQQGIKAERSDRPVNVIAKAKGTDPRHLAWLGATVLAQLPSSQELWILRSEYQELGVRSLREKVSFLW